MDGLFSKELILTSLKSFNSWQRIKKQKEFLMVFVFFAFYDCTAALFSLIQTNLIISILVSYQI